MMRRQALRASSTHNVCVFCATRLNNGNLLDAALHPLPLSAPSSVRGAATAAPAAARCLQQRRGISSTRPSQNFGGGAAAQQQQQQHNNADAERDAPQNRFNAVAPPAQPPMKLLLLQRQQQQEQQQQQQQQQSQQQQSAAADAEAALLKARFSRPPAPAAPAPSFSAPSPQFRQQESSSRGLPVTFHTPRGDRTVRVQQQPQPSRQQQQPQQQQAGRVPVWRTNATAPSGYQVRVEHARQLRAQQREEETAGFDAAKVSQWKITAPTTPVTPRGQETMEKSRIAAQPPGNVVRRTTTSRQDGDKSYVPLGPEQKLQDRQNFLSRFNRLAGSGGSGAAQEQQAKPQGFVKPPQVQAQALPTVSPSTGNAEQDLLKAKFAPPPPPPPPPAADPAPFSFQPRSQSRADPRPNPEHDPLMSRFSIPSAQPRPRFERDFPRDQFSRSTAASWTAPAEDMGTAENSEAGLSQETEMQPQELEQMAMPQVQERERPTRFSKFADVEEEAPRKRKARGGRSRDDSYEEDEVDISRIERKSKKKDKRKQRVVEVVPPIPIYLPEYLSVVNLANMLRVRTEDLVSKMTELGYEDINNDDILNAENAGLIAMEYNFEPVAADPSEDLDLYPAPEPEDKTIFPARPPVVTIMGHVDHGKTTLLDYLRKSSVAATEFGGITQHIGAFSVPLSNGKTITFLDTPGHAAFLNMRQRGATVTDIVILVVAADDSVKPQTLEAIKHAKSARVPIIVAINKIDKEGANPERVKQDLARHGVDVEDFGGDIQAIPVSGKTGQGMQDLEEAAITLSEILDHRADPEGPVEGWVLEASTKKSGKVATVLVRRGTLTVGTIIVAGQTFARVRSIKNEAGVDIRTVGPGMPAEIDGWRGQPEAGDEVLEAPNEQRATEVVEYREANAERIQMAKDMEAINEQRRVEHEKRERERERERALAAAAAAGEEDPEATVAAAEQEALEAATEKASGPTEVPFVVKADVSGSVEAVVDYVMTVGNGEVRPRVIRTGVGVVSESDVELAATTGGHVVAFNTAIESRTASAAEAKGVRVLEQNVIYRLVDDVKALLSERLAPAVTYRVTGEAAVLEVFAINMGRKKSATVAGCRVTNGAINIRSKVRVFRGEEKVYDGKISSLKQVKKDITEMQKGNECGMAFEDWGDFKAGDTIQCYEEKFEKRSL